MIESSVVIVGALKWLFWVWLPLFRLQGLHAAALVGVIISPQEFWDVTYISISLKSFLELSTIAVYSAIPLYTFPYLSFFSSNVFILIGGDGDYPLLTLLILSKIKPSLLSVNVFFYKKCLLKIIIINTEWLLWVSVTFNNFTLRIMKVTHPLRMHCIDMIRIVVLYFWNEKRLWEINNLL